MEESSVKLEKGGREKRRGWRKVKHQNGGRGEGNRKGNGWEKIVERVEGGKKGRG